MTILPDIIGYLADYTLYMTDSQNIYFHPLIPWMPVLWSSLSIHLGIICNPFCPPSGAKSALLIILFIDLGKPSRTKNSFFNINISFSFRHSASFFWRPNILKLRYFPTPNFPESKTKTFFSAKSETKKISETKS